MKALWPDKHNLPGYGDFIGGVFGTLLGGISLILLAYTWLRSHKKSTEDAACQMISDYCDNHESIIQNLKYINHKGIEVFSVILSEFYTALRHVKAEAKTLSIMINEQQEIDIAFHFVYYGTALSEIHKLPQHNTQLVTNTQKALSRNIKRLQPIIGSSTVVADKGRDFRGHQNNLGHYFRNLYAAFRELDDNKRIPNRLKLQLGRRIRSRLSNYEQAILFLNTTSLFGENWGKKGIIKKYELIRNIPKNFFHFGNTNDTPIHKRLNPTIIFEWEDSTLHELPYNARRINIFDYQIIAGDSWTTQPNRTRTIFIQLLHNNAHPQMRLETYSQTKEPKKNTVI